MADLLTAPAPAASARPLAFSLARPHHFLHLLVSFGVFGLFLVSIVDSSFVPLPVPGMTDIMIIIFAAQHTNVLLLVASATAGSAFGGYFSYQVGHSGGMSFLEKHVPPSIFQRVCNWMEHHAILAVALPALLPPPMPLSPFVLAAGALKMSRKTFMSTFTISRAIRHSIAAFLGVRYGRIVVHLWNAFSRKWATPTLIVLWTVIGLSCGIAFWKLYRTSKAVRGGQPPPPQSGHAQPHAASRG